MHRLLTLILALAAFTTAAIAQTPYKPGNTIPASLTFTDSSGKTHTLSEFRGAPVVLEWTNYGCPFVQKHYNSGNMQQLQSTYTGKGVTWISVISSAPGKQGYLTPTDAPAAIAKMGFKGTLVALDADGDIGRAFNATHTPTMAVLNADGKLVYLGAIDSIPSFDAADIAKATNYVSQALDATLAGEPVATAQTQAYGCSVKY